MIDIHSHILPGVDDGAADLDESLAMARLAVARGTTVLFATPHVFTRGELARAAEIAVRVSDLQQALDRAAIPLRLATGAEVYPMDGIVPALEGGAPLTLAGSRYLLLDSPLRAIPLNLGQLIFDLQTLGITPILAHPERVLPVQQDPQVLESLLQRGLLLQVNAGSVQGRFGETAARTALLLLRLHWVHFLASDAHASTTRRPGISAAMRMLIPHIGEQEAIDLVEKNGKCIIENTVVPTHPLAYTPAYRESRWLAWAKSGVTYVKRVCAIHA